MRIDEIAGAVIAAVLVLGVAIPTIHRKLHARRTRRREIALAVAAIEAHTCHGH